MTTMNIECYSHNQGHNKANSRKNTNPHRSSDFPWVGLGGVVVKSKAAQYYK